MAVSGTTWVYLDVVKCINITVKHVHIQRTMGCELYGNLHAILVWTPNLR